MGMALHSTTIVVRDQDGALRFFVELLGWEKDEDAMMGPVNLVQRPVQQFLFHCRSRPRLTAQSPNATPVVCNG